MKINLLVLALLIVSSLRSSAQGVIHLGPGDSYLFSGPTYVGGKIDELGRTASGVSAGFTGDLFTAGDSLQIDLLTSPTSPTPLATSTVSGHKIIRISKPDSTTVNKAMVSALFISD